MERETCPCCGGPVWDNRTENITRKKEGKVLRPDFSCRDKDVCKWVQWPPKEPKESKKEKSYKDIGDCKDCQRKNKIINDILDMCSEEVGDDGSDQI